MLAIGTRGSPRKRPFQCNFCVCCAIAAGAEYIESLRADEAELVKTVQRNKQVSRRAAPRRATTRIAMTASISHVRLTHSIHSPIYTPRAAVRCAAQHVMELKLLCFGPSGDEDDDDDDDEMPLCLRGSATLHTEAADSPGSRTRLLKVSAPAEDPAHAHAWVLGDGGVLTTRWPAQVADAMEDEEWRAALITALNHRRCASPSPWRSLPPWRTPRQAVRGRVLGGSRAVSAAVSHEVACLSAS